MGRNFFALCMLLVLIVALILTSKENKRYIAYTDFESYVEQSEVEEIQVITGSNIARIFISEDRELRLVRFSSIEVMQDIVDKQKKQGDDIKFEIVKLNIISKLFVEGNLPLAISITTIVIIAIMQVITWYRGYWYEYSDINVQNENVEEVVPGGVNTLQTDVNLDQIEIRKGDVPNVKFEDVAGIDEEKEQVEQLVDFLKNPYKYHEMGAQIPKGVLLIGAPGTGKTLLARAIAGEANATFFEVTGSSFEEKYVGVGAARVRELFKNARKYAPSIIFIDEIDAVAAKRYKTRNHSEATLNQLLTEMDGFNSSDDVIVIAATNYPEILDDAITRPGRFDRKVYIPMPDVTARKKILLVHSKNKKIAEDVSLDEIAKKTVGFAGADLKNLLNEAAILAVTEGLSQITLREIDEAYVRVIVGLEKKNRIISEEERYETAVHEAGHAIASAVLRPHVEIFGISIVQRGSAGGFNIFNPNEKAYYYKDDAIADMIVSYAGRVAEEICIRKVSSGPSSDLMDACKIANKMVNKLGMGNSLLTTIGAKEFDLILIKQNMDNVNKICNDAYEKSRKIIFENINTVEELADLLMEKEVLTSEEVKAFINSKELRNSYKINA